MVPLDSTLQGREEPFEHVRSYLHEHEFTLGGNWDYEHGSFDRYLDEGHKVWLRIPFEVTSGVLDGDTDSTDAFVRIGTPFVLKHVYNEGLDHEAQVRTFGALVDQFQEPLDKDGTVEDKWVDQAASLLREIERGYTTP
ncbi:YugN-like family protein [Paenibacillus sp. MZ04-78.2]|uniref:YugN-like family protein n=1 Tax=Paenibacillus sp. MZ04-78.2 TaxID=2962034 RepID=UPI0020B86B8C|nr:YugN-like family protein [Paenibacillus sp. MZ04-78.2]MCP3773482.1 YugN-like family protein [Paenibacillus sp. MZ04-78.2]